MSWLSAIWDWYSSQTVVNGVIFYPHASLINPVVAGVGAALLIGAAIQQARIATRRHRAQTLADQQRRITESFAKATEQLGSDKIEVRLGGIYTLERISRESPSDHWTIMETVTAFVREHARWKEPDAIGSETMARFLENKESPGTQSDYGPVTDIAAVLSIIIRRDRRNIAQEKTERWRFNLRGTDLRKANLNGAHLEGANLSEAYGNADTTLPQGVTRPKGWQSAQSG